MWKWLKNFIVGHIWPFSAYQRKVNVLSEQISFMEKIQEKNEKEKEGFIQKLGEKTETENALNTLVKHMEQLDGEKKQLAEEYQQVQDEKEKWEEEYRVLDSENKKLQIKVDNQLKVIEELKEKIDKITVLEELVKHVTQLGEEKSQLNEKRKQLEEEKKQLLQERSQILNEKEDLENKIECYEKGNVSNDRLGMSSGEFWNRHYKNNGNSGTGSYHRLAEFKAEIVNHFLIQEKIKTVIEIGCGDGNQLSLIHYDNYTGVDVSEVIIEKNRQKYQNDKNKRFFCTLTEREKYINQKYEMSLSMDVIFHLLEDEIFYNYMEDLFLVAEKYVLIYSSNHEEYTRWPEYRHRNFISYIQEKISGWKLHQFIPNRYPYQIGKEETTSASDFYIFRKID